MGRPCRVTSGIRSAFLHKAQPLLLATSRIGPASRTSPRGEGFSGDPRRRFLQESEQFAFALRIGAQDTRRSRTEGYACPARRAFKWMSGRMSPRAPGPAILPSPQQPETTDVDPERTAAKHHGPDREGP